MRMKFVDACPILIAINAMHWLLSVQGILAHSMMQCGLYPVYNVYCAVHCALCTVNCTITVPCALCTIHCTGHCTQCTMYTTLVTVPCALCTFQCSLYTVHYPLHWSQCTMYTALVTVPCAQCTLHWSLARRRRWGFGLGH